MVRLLLYYGFATHLPASDVSVGRLAQPVRRAVCRRLFRGMGVGVNIERHAHFGSGRELSIGDHSALGINCRISGPVDIGSYVMMGPDVMILSRRHEIGRVDIPMALQGEAEARRVVVEDDVWIGARVIVLAGVRIGRGSVLGAGAVVARDVPPLSVVVGNPARVIRTRRREGILENG